MLTACALMCVLCCFFFNDTATTEIYTLSLHDALPISEPAEGAQDGAVFVGGIDLGLQALAQLGRAGAAPERHAEHVQRSEEHTSELQSRQYLVCRLLLEKKKKVPIDPCEVLDRRLTPR